MFDSFLAQQRTVTPGPRCSERYVQISTSGMVDALADLGYNVHGIQTGGPRTRDVLRAKHIIDMRMDTPAHTLDDGTVPRVLIINSHNGGANAVFCAGMFRFLCANGLMTGTAWGNERVRHYGEQARGVIERAKAAAAQTVRALETASEWQRKLLTREQQIKFADRAAVLRFGKHFAQHANPETLLEVRRQGDEGDDLWRVFNRVQEAGMRGGVPTVSSRGRRGTARGLVGVQSVVRWNQGVWDLAEQIAAEV